MNIKYRVVYGDLLIIIFFFLLSLGLSIITELKINNNSKYIFFFISSVLLGFWFHAFHLFLHEAAHYNLHKNRKINDIIAKIFFIPTLGVKIEDYRKHHWEHHKYIGTTNDTENSYFSDLSIKSMLLSMVPFFLILKKGLSSKTNSNENPDNDLKIIKSKTLLIMITFHATVVGLIFINGFKFTSIVYLFFLVILFPWIAQTRQKLEHRNINATKEIDYKKYNHGEYNRIFSNSFISRYLGAAGFNKHYLHHINPNISYTNFEEYENYIKDNNKDLDDKINKSKTTYLDIFFRLLKN
tara:strand:+ start:628 stop:1518 length:891 start_codon:yes stop_codon:yes gene_type:complete